MADGATTSSWFPVVTLLVGYMTKSISEWIQHRRTTERERLQHRYAAEREREARDAARRDQLFERRNSFQRQTLLDLQDHCTHAIMSATEKESERALMDMGTVFETLNERVGGILRQLDDEGGCPLGSST